METTRKNFGDVFCDKRGIPRARFVDALLKRSLYPHARLLLPVCMIFNRRIKMRDRQVMSDVGLATSVRDIEAILNSLPAYYGGGWAFRKAFRLRISSRRVLKVARKMLPDGATQEAPVELIPSRA